MPQGAVGSRGMLALPGELEEMLTVDCRFESLQEPLLLGGYGDTRGSMVAATMGRKRE